MALCAAGIVASGALDHCLITTKEPSPAWRTALSFPARGPIQGQCDGRRGGPACGSVSAGTSERRPDPAYDVGCRHRPRLARHLAAVFEQRWRTKPAGLQVLQISQIDFALILRRSRIETIAVGRIAAQAQPVSICRQTMIADDADPSR